MKKTILILAAALAVIVSCQKAETDNTAPVLTKITVVAENSLDADTKVTVGDAVDGACPVLWQAGDRVCLIDRTADSRPVLATVEIPSEYDGSNSASLTFEADLSGKPANTQLGLMLCREGFGYNDNKVLPADQVQSKTGAENVNFMDYTYAFTSAISVFNTNGTMKETLAFSMKHPFAYVKIPFSSSKYAGYKVSSVIITTEAENVWLAGRVSINGAADADKAITKMAPNDLVPSSQSVKLTFTDDVIVTAETQEAWMVALPTAIASNTASQTVYTVAFEMENDGASVTAEVKFKTVLNASAVNVLKVGEILETDVTASKDISNDFFEQYLAGHDIRIGDLVVNKENYPEYTLKQPSEISLGLLKEGGLIFIDDVNGDSEVDLTTTNSFETCPSTTSGGLVLIGRYKIAGKQTELKFKQWRTYADLAIKNVGLTCTNSSVTLQMFAKSGDDKNQTDLMLQDCNIDIAMAKYLIEDMQGSGCVPYSAIAIDNCVVKMTDSDSVEPSLYRYRNTTTKSETISITNNVVYTSSLKNNQCHLFWIHNDIEASGITVSISGNTILNLHGNTGIIRRPAKLAGITVEGNLVVADNTANSKVITTEDNRKLYFVKNTTTLSSGNNYLTVINYTGDTNTINCFVPSNPGVTEAFKPASTDVVVTAETEDKPNPFTSLNYTTGYFPVDASVVTNGAGASYETKYFIPQN